MRLFIAIRLSDDMKEALMHAQNEMYAHGLRGNYTKEENLHLTLAFIGEYPDPQPVMDALQTVTFTPFELELCGMGCFGDLWWVGMKESPALYAVVHQIRKAMSDAGIPFDRKRFTPYITLIRKGEGKITGIEVEKDQMIVNNISLMRSERGKSGMLYTEVGVKEAKYQ